jgi:hypothetical protein
MSITRFAVIRQVSDRDSHVCLPADRGNPASLRNLLNVRALRLKFSETFCECPSPLDVEDGNDECFPELEDCNRMAEGTIHSWRYGLCVCNPSAAVICG